MLSGTQFYRMLVLESLPYSTITFLSKGCEGNLDTYANCRNMNNSFFFFFCNEVCANLGNQGSKSDREKINCRAELSYPMVVLMGGNSKYQVE